MRVNGTSLEGTSKSKQGDSFIYDFARLIGAPFSYDVKGYENILTGGPAIFLANHHGAIGPLAVILSVPVRFYPWVIAEMLDFKLAPQYLFDDFIHPVLHLGGRLGLVFSSLLTKISVRLLRAIGSVSIDRFGGLTTDGFRQSLKLLRDGKNLLIFPEDPLQPIDPLTLIRPFMPGFANLCHLFQSAQGGLLPVYPLAVHAQCEMVSIGEPEYYNEHGSRKVNIDNFCFLMESRVKKLYQELNSNFNDLIV